MDMFCYPGENLAACYLLITIMNIISYASRRCRGHDSVSKNRKL